MNILYIPLDERPCNVRYPQDIASLQDDVSLIVPSMESLGHKKQSADVEQLWSWIKTEVEVCQTAILSIEMLVYGGLLPSRLHHHSISVLGDRLNRIRQLKMRYPHLTLLASTLIMRTPSYNSSEEEPDYYEEWGKAIFQWGWFYDKQQRDGLSDAETDQFDHLRQTLPTDWLNDYRDRRSKNLAVNKGAIALVKDGTLDFLSIPQDDSARYGFTALDQKQVVSQIIEARLQTNIHLYPGADEVGCSLLARAYSMHTRANLCSTPSKTVSDIAVKDQIAKDQIANDQIANDQIAQHQIADDQSVNSPSKTSSKTPSANDQQSTQDKQIKDRWIKIYPLYSSVQSPHIIPLYEDRPLGESLKSHVLVAGARLVPHPDDADIILAVNTPGKVMQEAWDQPVKDVTYTTYRNLRFFVVQIEQYVRAGKPVAIADVAFANGGETELVQLLDDAGLWDELLAYAGWNTCCNSMGTAIATAILGLHSPKPAAVNCCKIYRLLEDWAYQSVVRADVVNQYLPTIGASYYDFNNQEVLVLNQIKRRILQTWTDMMQHSFKASVVDIDVYSPWHRMFETGLTVRVRDHGADS